MKNLRSLLLIMTFSIVYSCTTVEVKYETVFDPEIIMDPIEFPDGSIYIDVPVFVYQNHASGIQTGIEAVQVLVDGTEAGRTDGYGYIMLTLPVFETELYFRKKGFLDKKVNVRRSLRNLGLQLNMEKGDQSDGTDYDIQMSGRMKDSSEVSVVLDGSMGGPSKGGGP